MARGHQRGELIGVPARHLLLRVDVQSNSHGRIQQVGYIRFFIELLCQLNIHIRKLFLVHHILLK